MSLTIAVHARSNRASDKPTCDGGWVAMELDRIPDLTRTSIRTDGNVPALRTHNEPLWVVRLEGGLHWSRSAHLVERLTLQGFPPEVAQGMSKKQLLRATGNAFSVPVVGAVLSQLLRFLHSQGVLGPTAADPAIADWLGMPRRFAIERRLWHEIAPLQAEARLSDRKRRRLADWDSDQ